jgi:hypothetical protein
MNIEEKLDKMLVGEGMSVADKHQLAIAKKTLKMTPAMAKIMGGMNHDEAKEVIARLTGKKVK